MGITTEEVRKIASLARLRFSPEEESVFVDQLGKIVDYIDQLQSRPSSEVEIPSPGAREAEDQVHECLPRERFLANAPAAALDAFLLVPEVKGGGENG